MARPGPNMPADWRFIVHLGAKILAFPFAAPGALVTIAFVGDVSYLRSVYRVLVH